jgi:copper chaperone CopZ
MKLMLLIPIFFLGAVTISFAQIKNPQTASIKIAGNCEECKAAIEKSVYKKNWAKASWSNDSKIAAITYDSKKTNINTILKNIALAGYDNESFLAPDVAYNKLPACCKYDRTKKVAIKKIPIKDSAIAINNHDTHPTADTLKPVQEINQLQAIFTNYFSLKDALIKTDAGMAAAQANKLLSALNDVKMETLKMDEHMAWMKVEKDLKTNSQRIVSSKKIEQQRMNFSTLSTNMYLLVKASKLTDAIYYQNCPMYNNNKGANWLSKELAIKNPYYGSMMLTCGSTIETIK